jgi:hypothetical protein
LSDAPDDGTPDRGEAHVPYDAPMPRRRSERSDTTRRAILDAAQSLMTDQGYEHTRIEQITERAGVSIPGRRAP